MAPVAPVAVPAAEVAPEAALAVVAEAVEAVEAESSPTSPRIVVELAAPIQPYNTLAPPVLSRPQCKMSADIVAV